MLLAFTACSDSEPLSIAEVNKSGSAGAAGAIGKISYKAGQAGSSGMPSSPMPVDILVPGAFDQRKTKNLPMRYEGGPIMAHDVNVYMIWYGDWNPNTTSILEDMISNIAKTDWYMINNSYYQELIFDQYANIGNKKFPITLKSYKQYASSKINFMMSVTDLYSKGKDIDDSDMEKIISTLIKENKLPLDSNGIYVILTSQDVDHSAYFGGFCSDFCGWHNYFPISNTNVKYSFVGDIEKCPKVCSVKKEYLDRDILSPNGDWSADGMASIIAHELVEVVTDPLPLFNRAWGDSSGYENADKCSWTYGQLYKTENGSAANVKIGDRDFLIQQNWVLDDSIGNGHCGLSR